MRLVCFLTFCFFTLAFLGQTEKNGPRRDVESASVKLKQGSEVEVDLRNVDSTRCKDIDSGDDLVCQASNFMNLSIEKEVAWKDIVEKISNNIDTLIDTFLPKLTDTFLPKLTKEIQGYRKIAWFVVIGVPVVILIVALREYLFKSFVFCCRLLVFCCFREKKLIKDLLMGKTINVK